MAGLYLILPYYHLLQFCSGPKKLNGGHVISIILLSPTNNESRDRRLAFLGQNKNWSRGYNDKLEGQIVF